MNNLVDVSSAMSALERLDVNGGQPKENQHKALQELTKPHIDSFNHMIRHGIHDIVEHMLPVEFELPGGQQCALYLKGISILPPRLPDTNKVSVSSKIYPAECRERRSTYRGDVQVKMGWKINGNEEGFIERSPGQIPVMVKSDLCYLANLTPKDLIRHGEEAEEMGGYFIVNGQEKIVRMLVLQRRNFPLCLKRPSWKTRGSDFTEYGIIMRCVRADQSASNMFLHYIQNGTVMVGFTYNKEIYYAPLMMILKGLVDVCDKQIFDDLTNFGDADSYFKGCVVFMLREMLERDLVSQTEMLQYIGERFRIRLELPMWYTHGQLHDPKAVCIRNREMCEESADNPMFQELLLSGHLMQLVLKEKLESWLQSVRLNMLRILKKTGDNQCFTVSENVVTKALLQSIKITRGMEYLLATGNLVSKTGLGLLQASGLAIIADKLNFNRYISHFRSVHRGAFFAQMRTTAVRKLLPEAWGFLCPVHTPDGAPCGLLNHMAAICQVVNIQHPRKPILQQLSALGMTQTGLPIPVSLNQCYPVLLDGELVGQVWDIYAESLVKGLRLMKITGQRKIPATLEICLVPKTELASQYPGVYLFSTIARMMRPVIHLATGKLEMIGPFEQVYLDIAVYKDEIHKGITTHLEVNEQCILSVNAKLIPFPDFNQSPRNMYQCQMGKQTMGTPLHALEHRSDNKLYRILTPQSPLVRPQAYEQYHVDEYPLGTNAIVAVISYTGYDMEDAMVINKSSYERGFAHGCIYKTVEVDLTQKHDGSYVFGCKQGGTEGLDPDGLPPVGKLLQDGDPHYSYINIQTGAVKVDLYKGSESAFVQQVKVLGSETGQGPLNRVIIVLRIPRNPTIGDKFSSRHGQKGVCSMLWPAEDMPFTESGMTPDIIFNPHGFPSRMTIGMMIESMAGKAAALHGLYLDATPFTFSEDQPASDYFGSMLTAGGYNYYGTERMYSGVDGRELTADIFFGVVYYQRLRHMVSDKYQVRSTGPIDPLTQQPVKGRKRMGGVRFGEMERDALIAHGSSFLLQDRLLNCSDRCTAMLCKECESLVSPVLDKPAPNIAAVTSEARRQWRCRTCGQTDSVGPITLPFVLRFLVAELAVMGINMTFKVRPGV
ncbi:hypothetical protein C0Q70_10416 [Pomacea canaliculata]|uniref:DNA-directed RNA polymerase subunit beta n=1 Tax=Pomacea canaliculata TaxID=400727 RepID=A0A2T7PCI5_POMCA|nr:hypothetical protein C0Q70_10416 [Pomacea canaliculata]